LVSVDPATSTFGWGVGLGGLGHLCGLDGASRGIGGSSINGSGIFVPSVSGFHSGLIYSSVTVPTEVSVLSGVQTGYLTSSIGFFSIGIAYFSGYQTGGLTSSISYFSAEISFILSGVLISISSICCFSSDLYLIGKVLTSILAASIGRFGRGHFFY
jgi:hypothetical protein